MSAVTAKHVGSKYSSYAEYKDTDVEWIREIPTHWEVKRLKVVTRFAYGDSLPEEQRQKGEIPVFGSNGLVGYHNKANAAVPCIIIGRKGSFGKVVFSEEPSFAIDTTYYIDCTQTREDLRWLYYGLLCLELDSFSKDSAVPGLSREDAYHKFMPYCAIQEQKVITDFLNYEITKIDELIARKQKLIELLQEQRTAMITRTVTKGLNPDAPMKDSGVEWLGEIPAHWDIIRLKYGVTLINDKIENGESDTPYLGLENVESWTGRIIETDFKPEIEGASNSFRKDDVLFGKLRPYLAKAVHTQYHGICTSELMVLRPQKYYSRFLFYYMLSPSTVNIIDSSTYGVKMPRANWHFIGNLPFVVPPISEQQAITDYLDKETSRINSLVGRIIQAIEKLKEYRSALITAAVTGKIDLRQQVS